MIMNRLLASRFIVAAAFAVVVRGFLHRYNSGRPFGDNTFSRRLSLKVSAKLSSFDWLVNSALPIKLVGLDKGKKKRKQPLRNFRRTNRVDGQEKWIKELFLYKSQLEQAQRAAVMDGSNATSQSLLGSSSSFLIVELAKELLYSGIPEQVLELYAAYCDIIVSPYTTGSGTVDKSSTSSEKPAPPVYSQPVAQDPKLILVTTRAFIALGDIKGALQLLQATSRSGLDFDAESKSLLMADLAECSPEGLQAALRLRASMRERRERVSANGYAGLVKGIWQHGISPRRSGVRLLLDAAAEDRALDAELGINFRLSLSKALELTMEIADEFYGIEHLNSTANSTSNSSVPVSSISATQKINGTAAGKAAINEQSKAAVKPSPSPAPSPAHTHKVMSEVLRVVFRVAAVGAKGKFDRNFEADVYREREEKSLTGLSKTLEVITRYRLPFDIHTADVLVDECLRVGDVNGVKFVAQKMWVNGLYARTNTFNALLHRYASSGDGESAYRLVSNVMMPSEETKPNSETWALLLQSCLRTSRGRYYARKVVDHLRGAEEIKPSIKRKKTSKGGTVTEEAIATAAAAAVAVSEAALPESSTAISAGIQGAASTASSLSPEPMELTHIRKEEWDCWMQLEVLERRPHEPVLRLMVQAGCQPDDASVMTLMDAFARTGEKEAALRLHRLQVSSELRRRQFRKGVLERGLYQDASLSSTTSTSTAANKESVSQANGKAGNVSASNKVVVQNSPIDVTSSVTVSTGTVTAAPLDSSSDGFDADVALYLPPPTRRAVHSLLEILADGSAASCEQALRVLGDMCDRAEEMGAPYAEDGTSRSPLNTEYDDFKIDKDRKALRPEILPVSLTASGRRILAAQYSPDQTTFALVIEACVACRQPSKALEAFAQMERWGLRPDRRVYAALIQAFGINGGSGGDERVRDVASALGVFDEMRKNFAPDVANLQSILDVCMEEPLDLRLLCPVLEALVNEGLDLEVYSNDVLMQGFPDAVELGRALEMMEREPVPSGFQCVTASLDVITVLVQAARRAEGVGPMVEAMAMLGRAGIRPDEDTMEYFRIPDAPALGSPNSRHYNRQLVPHRERVRSLMDIEMPAGLAPDLSLPKRGSGGGQGKDRSTLAAADRGVGLGVGMEPYFESGSDEWLEHSAVLQLAVLGAEGPGLGDDGYDGYGGDDDDLSELLPGQDIEGMLLAGAFGGDDADLVGIGVDQKDGIDIDVDRNRDIDTGRGVLAVDKMASISVSRANLVNVAADKVTNSGSGLRTGTGPYGGDLGVFEDLMAIDGIGGTPEVVPLEIKEAFLGQARPRAKSSTSPDVWTPSKGKGSTKGSTTTGASTGAAAKGTAKPSTASGSAPASMTAAEKRRWEEKRQAQSQSKSRKESEKWERESNKWTMKDATAKAKTSKK